MYIKTWHHSNVYSNDMLRLSIIHTLIRTGPLETLVMKLSRWHNKESSTCSWHLPVFDVVFSQAFTPSSHVYSKFGSPAAPHFKNHEPPKAQQVRPSLSETHLEHARMWTMFCIVEISLPWLVTVHTERAYLLLGLEGVIGQAFTPSPHVCSNFGSLLRPHFWNHDPPFPQQLGEPLILPHWAQPEKQCLASISFEWKEFRIIIIMCNKTQVQCRIWRSKTLPFVTVFPHFPHSSSHLNSTTLLHFARHLLL